MPSKIFTVIVLTLTSTLCVATSPATLAQEPAAGIIPEVHKADLAMPGIMPDRMF